MRCLLVVVRLHNNRWLALLDPLNVSPCLQCASLYLHFLQDFIQGYPFMVSTMLVPGQTLGTLPGTSVTIEKKVTIALLS